jgi:hypothetical protein
MLDKRVVVFQGDNRPGIQVLREGDWHGGELRSWHQRDTGWVAEVQYRVGHETTYVERVTSDRVRPA